MNGMEEETGSEQVKESRGRKSSIFVRMLIELKRKRERKKERER